MSEQQYILTVAGVDPSNGAGLTADLKTFQAHGLYGLSVCTTVTVQNDIDFKSAHWLDQTLILEQIRVLFERFEIRVAKIGIVENWPILLLIVKEIVRLNPSIQIVLDPVLKASAGFDFHNDDELEVLDEVLSMIHMITPNFEEIQQLYPYKTIEETIDHLRSKTNVYLKGGHRTDRIGLDEVFYDDQRLEIEPEGENISPKHGSGCVLSSALASQFALGASLQDAAVSSKRYTEQFLSSTPDLLGNHRT